MKIPRFTLRLLSLLMLSVAIAYPATNAEVRLLSNAQLDRQALNRIPATDFLIGNLDQPVGVMPNWFTGSEEYLYYFSSAEQFAQWEIGFLIENMYLLMQFGPEDVPVTFDVGANLGVEFHQDYLQLAPCETQVATVHIESPGLYGIGIPFEGFEECCAYIHYVYWPGSFNYWLYFQIISEFPEDMRPDGIEGSPVNNCLTQVRRGGDWLALCTLGWPGNGNIVLWADGVYCGWPITSKMETWGSIKALYR